MPRQNSSVNGKQNSTFQENSTANELTDINRQGFFTVDRNWTVKSWNGAAEKLLGIKSSEVLGKNLWNVFPKKISLNFYKMYHKAFLYNTPIHFEEYWEEKDTWYDIVTYHINDVISVAFKVVERTKQHIVQPEKQLKILNDLYRFVTEVMNDCLWEWNFKTKEIFWIDGGHRRIFGYPIENAFIPQIFWENLVHPDDLTRVMSELYDKLDNYAENNKQGCTWQIEYRFRKMDGEYIYVRDCGHIFYQKGKAARMIGSTQDINDHKINELKLLESEKKLSIIARQTVNAVILTDVDEKITWVNNAFTRITGYEQDEVIGTQPGTIFNGPKTNPETVLYVTQMVKDQLPYDCDILHYRKSGSAYWVHLHGEALFDDAGKFERYFVIQTEITERIKLETALALEKLKSQQEITRAVIEAQEKERATIGKELHDNLNQVLGTAKLFVEMATPTDKASKMYLKKSAAYIVNVIEEIRKISKTLLPPGMAGVGLSESIRILVDDVNLLGDLKVEFNETGISDIALDKKLKVNIFRIIQEQINNIIKHSKARFASIALSMQQQAILLVIADYGNGCDISKKNTGVGVRNIISRAELYHGNVTIISKPGEGYLLKMVIPLD